MQFILYLLLILLFIKVAGHLSVKLGQPAVLGKLIAGIVLGPAVLGWVQNDSVIHNMSEIGVLLRCSLLDWRRTWINFDVTGSLR